MGSRMLRPPERVVRTTQGFGMSGGVPWCVHCNRFLTPSTVRPNATCPVCGEVVERGLLPGLTTRRADESEKPGVPWHLKLLGAATALYLGFRFLQLIDWI